MKYVLAVTVLLIGWFILTNIFALLFALIGLPEVLGTVVGLGAAIYLALKTYEKYD